MPSFPVSPPTAGAGGEYVLGRLGHGGGYYDRFLAWAPGDMAAAMVCFSDRLVDAVPMGELDIPVPLVVTEEGTWREGALWS